MLLLAFDTAGPQCAVALARGDQDSFEILAGETERMVRGHAERLVPMIEAALDQSGLAFGDIERIAVTIGPGSFTGVRVGVAAGRGLGLALGIPVLGIGTLHALAAMAVESHRYGTAVAVLEARREEIYALVQDVASGRLLQGPAVGRVHELAGSLAALPKPLILTGAGAPLLAAALDEPELEMIRTAEAPEIASVAALGFRAAPGGPPPVPLYLRGADAKPQTGKALERA
jgi:tRNA threonylcarbamoyl adenosine modification protein YeaZ